MMIGGMALGALWRRGWWVVLILIASDLLLAVLSAVVGYILKPLSANSFEIAALVVGFTLGPIILGLMFEVLASELPRLGPATRIDDAV
jgi:hypothetical protein